VEIRGKKDSVPKMLGRLRGAMRGFSLLQQGTGGAVAEKKPKILSSARRAAPSQSVTGRAFRNPNSSGEFFCFFGAERGKSFFEFADGGTRDGVEETKASGSCHLAKDREESA